MKLFFSWKCFPETSTSLKGTVGEFLFKKHFKRGPVLWEKNSTTEKFSLIVDNSDDVELTQ